MTQGIAFFDFDDTLARGDSILPFLLYCIRRGIAPRRQLIKAAGAFLYWKLRPSQASRAKSATLSFLRGRSADEMLDIAAMAQSTPGAIAVNAAVLTGTRIGGTIGMFVAVLGTVIPPVVLLSVLSLCYEAFRQLYPVRLALAGMQAGVAAVILDVAWGLGKNVVRKKDRVDLVLMALVFIAQWFTHLNTAVIILSAAAVGLARGLIRLYGKGGNRQ